MKAKYLNFNTSLQRLLDEYYQHGRLIVAYDFDDTVCTYTHGNPEPTLEREPNEEICQLIRDLRPYATFIVWTCRSNDLEHSEEPGPLTALQRATLWLDQHEMPYDHINDDAAIAYGGRKIYANIFLDDRAGLITSYELLTKFIELVQRGQKYV